MTDSEDSSQQKGESFSARQMRAALAHVRERRRYFQLVGSTLARQAKSMSLASSLMTTAIIILGAFVSTKAVMDNLLGSTNMINVLVYTLAGVLIAMISGLKGAFKWDSKAAELRTIVARCRQAEHTVDIELRVIPEGDLTAATDLLRRIDAALNKIEEEVSKIGVDLLILSPTDPAQKSTFRDYRKKSSMLLKEMEDTAGYLDKLDAS